MGAVFPTATASTPRGHSGLCFRTVALMVRFFARRKEEQIPLPRLRDRNDSLGHFHLHWWTEGAPNTQGDMSFRASTAASARCRLSTRNNRTYSCCFWRAKRSGARNLLLIEALGHAVVLGLVCACCLRLARPGFAAQHLDAGHSSAVHADEAFQRINVLVSSHQFDAAERLFQQELL